MRSMYNYNFLTALIVLSLSFSIGFSQPRKLERIDRYRMQREIQKAESSLLDVIRIGDSVHANVSYNVFSTYIPEVGVVFRIRPASYSMSYYYRVSPGKNGKDVVLHSVEDHSGTDASVTRDLEGAAFQFLEKYAGTIQQLAEDERIVISSESPAYAFNVMGSTTWQPANANSQDQSFVISVRKADVEAYNSHKISAGEFRKRVQKLDFKKTQHLQKQLGMFANRFENAFKSASFGRFSMLGDPANMFIDDFGALFLFDAARPGWNEQSVFMRIDELKRLNEMHVENLRRIAEYLEHEGLDSEEASEVLENWTQVQLTDSTEMKYTQQAYQEFEKKVSEYLLDYGKAVRALNNQQRIALVVQIRGNTPGVPERVVFEINKQDLDAYNAQMLSKENALERVVIHRYEN